MTDTPNNNDGFNPNERPFPVTTGEGREHEKILKTEEQILDDKLTEVIDANLKAHCAAAGMDKWPEALKRLGGRMYNYMTDYKSIRIVSKTEGLAFYKGFYELKERLYEYEKTHPEIRIANDERGTFIVGREYDTPIEQIVACLNDGFLKFEAPHLMIDFNKVKAEARAEYERQQEERDQGQGSFRF